MNEKPGCPGTAAKLPYSPGNQKPTPPSSAHELFVDNKTEITNRNALNKRRTLDATTRMRLIVVKTCDAQIPGLMRTPCLLPLREQKGEFCAQLPVWRGVRSYRVVIGGKLRTHRLVTEFEHATKAATNRYGPALVRCRHP